MIRSRMQFGVYGAVIPLLLVSFLYIGFSAGGRLLAGQAVARLLHSRRVAGYRFIRCHHDLGCHLRLPRHTFFSTDRECGR
ncbi:cytosine permease, partial [Enterobacter hormaechei]|uniref:cytosine permease n=1 Tax=Enterobacter hormaechei TaxID=158836 RepID=UPI001EED5439